MNRKFKDVSSNRNYLILSPPSKRHRLQSSRRSYDLLKTSWLISHKPFQPNASLTHSEATI